MRAGGTTRGASNGSGSLEIKWRFSVTRDQADILIIYIEAMSERANHQSLMEQLAGDGVSEKELDDACRALGTIAQRDFSIL